jgi:hypothetical protein
MSENEQKSDFILVSIYRSENLAVRGGVVNSAELIRGRNFLLGIGMLARPAPLARKPQRRYHPGRCALRLSARTQDFHSCKRGSTPLGRTIKSRTLPATFRSLIAPGKLTPGPGARQAFIF